MIQHNQELGSFDLNSGGAGGQAEQVAAMHIWPPLPVPHPSIIEVVEDQVPVENICKIFLEICSEIFLVIRLGSVHKNILKSSQNSVLKFGQKSVQIPIHSEIC